MKEIIKNFFKIGDQFMLGMHLRQVVFTCGVCGPFTKNKKLI